MGRERGSLRIEIVGSKEMATGMGLIIGLMAQLVFNGGARQGSR